MKKIYDYLEQKQSEFKKHSFYNQLFEHKYSNGIACFAPKMTFWVMAFQDMLQLNLKQITHPLFFQIARFHQVEDAGHEKWFLNDLSKLGKQEPSLRNLYSQAHAPVRYASYTLVSEVFRSNNDFERIALLFSVESAAQVFFEQIARYSSIPINGFSTLEYFSGNHLEAEESHESFNQEVKAQLDNIQLTSKQEKEIVELIDRVYVSFTIILDELQTTLSTPHRSKGSEIEEDIPVGLHKNKTCKDVLQVSDLK
ncbi:hypothetical protein BLD44_024035 [Mastigocladus laminosus UU774]|nr:hypothetical protein BLD44_024035 [Mastigocladus laminosus UU774]